LSLTQHGGQPRTDCTCATRRMLYVGVSCCVLYDVPVAMACPVSACSAHVAHMLHMRLWMEYDIAYTALMHGSALWGKVL
jgi:hypothetical protein